MCLRLEGDVTSAAIGCLGVTRDSLPLIVAALHVTSVAAERSAASKASTLQEVMDAMTEMVRVVPLLGYVCTAREVSPVILGRILNLLTMRLPPSYSSSH